MKRKANSERACVVCRRTRPAMELLAFGRVDEFVCLERPGRGRGAYVCIARACLGNVGPKALGRAFKASVVLPESLRGAALLPTVHALAQTRLLATLGLARRCGDAVLGIDRVNDAANVGVGLAIAASDLSARSARKAERIGARPFLDAERIGKALGAGRVGLVALTPGSLCDTADYWLRLWSETHTALSQLDERSTDATAAPERGGGDRLDARDSASEVQIWAR